MISKWPHEYQEEKRTIEVVQAEIFEGQVEAFLYPVNVRRPNFRCDENIFPWYPRGFDPCTYGRFVAIRLGIGGEWLNSSTKAMSDPRKRNRYGDSLPLSERTQQRR